MLLKKGKPDYWLIIVVILLLGIGLVMVLSSSQYFAQDKYGDSFYFLKRQIKNALIGLVAMFFVMKIHYRKYLRLAWPFLIGASVLLVAVAVTTFGVASHGATLWLNVGLLQFQPSELMKIALVIFLAKSLSERQEQVKDFKNGFLHYMGILGLAGGLVGLQDLGSAVVMIAAACILLFCGGVRIKHMSLLVLVGIAGFIFLVIQEPFRLTRLTSFLDPWQDPKGSGYQTIQSLLAVGSGGLSGVGLGAGGAKWFYLPERHTDFIFSVLCEETGFIGGAFLIIIFAFFAWRGFAIAWCCRDSFGSLLATGLTVMLCLQAVINIAITVGALPVTGITLPFISYGGTSLVICLIIVGILLNISCYAEMDK